MKKNRKFLAAAALVAVVAGGGSAFTSSLNGVENFNTTAAEGTISVTGADLTNISYQSSASGITGATVQFDGHYDPAKSTVVYVSVDNQNLTCGTPTLVGQDTTPGNGSDDHDNDRTQAICTIVTPIDVSGTDVDTSVQLVSADDGATMDVA